MKNIINHLGGLNGRIKLEFIKTLVADRKGVTSTIEEYKVPNGSNHYIGHNLIIEIEGNENINLITAHHDTVNKNSDNTLDNNASILNAITIANSIRPKSTTIVAITDAEETCSTNLNGVRQILSKHKINQHLDLELTASGRNMLIAKYNQFTFLSHIQEMKMPFNNAYASSKMADGPIGSACVTIVDDDDLRELAKYGSCNRWSQCHSDNDTIQWFDESDVKHFSDFLIENINGF
jgi:hypothetical protein